MSHAEEAYHILIAHNTDQWLEFNNVYDWEEMQYRNMAGGISKVIKSLYRYTFKDYSQLTFWWPSKEGITIYNADGTKLSVLCLNCAWFGPRFEPCLEHKN